MIAFIKGTIADIETDQVVVEQQGIGYQVFVPVNVSGRVSMGETVQLFTYMQVKEDGISLFGFSVKDELRLFKQLIGVNGIGPKAAMNLLSYMTIDELRLAILSEDKKTISKAPGIGPKTAARMIIELKDKIDIETTLSVNATQEAKGDNEQVKEASEALIALGYTPTEALQCVRAIDIPEGAAVEEIIKLALKQMVRDR